MPIGKSRSASEPPSPSIADRRQVGDNKAASQPDLRGRLATSTNSYSLRLTGAEALPGPDATRPDSRVDGKQLSDYRVELTPAFDLSREERKDTPGPGRSATTEGQPSTFAVSGPPVMRPFQVPLEPRMPTGQSGIGERHTPVPDTGSAAVLVQTPAELRGQFNKPGVSLAGGVPEPVPHVAVEPKQIGKKARQAGSRQQVRAGTAKPGPIKRTEKSAKAGAVKAVNKVTVDQIPGLRDVFLSRAINHLITGELDQLDPMIGDESCQSRTPFVLDMHRLVQARMPANAVGLVRKYREKTNDEQRKTFETLRTLERSRKDKNPMYERNISDFIGSDPLKESRIAKSGEYEAMLADMISTIKESDPEYVDYLSHVCSEGSIYWEDVFDPFGISMLTDRHPIFPDSMLAKRKVGQSGYSKNYMAKTAAGLVEIGGGKVGRAEKELGYNKKGVMQKNSEFLVTQTNKDDISSMLLHALQFHSGAASTKNSRLEMAPCWETTRIALTHALKQNYPLLVNIRRLLVSGEGDSRNYSSNLSQTLFYEPSEEGYKYQPNPSEAQRSQGALLFQGYSMLREGDTTLERSVLPVSSWVFERDPDKYLDGLVKCDIANVLLLGGAGTHPPLNTGAPGSSAYGLPNGPPGDYKFSNDAGGVEYSEAIHDRVLADLGQSGSMTEAARQFLIPKDEKELREEYRGYLQYKAAVEAEGKEAEPFTRTLFRLTDKAKSLKFPDECPISLAGTGTKFNIKEEYQLLKLLSQAAGMENTIYSKEDRNTGTAKRTACKTAPFAIVHILASNYARQNEVSKQFSAPQTRGVTENLDELRKN